MNGPALDKTLKLVVDRLHESDDFNGVGSPYYVWASPLSLRVAKTYWHVFQNAAGMLYTSDLGAKSAPRYAAEAIRTAARQLGIGDEVEKNVIGEIQRLAMVVSPSGNGWSPVTFDSAVKDGVLSEDEADEVLNVLAFFTLALRFHSTNGGQRTVLVNGALGMHWNGRTTSSQYTEWLASLPTSTQVESSGETTTGASPDPSQTAHAGVRTISGSQVPS